MLVERREQDGVAYLECVSPVGDPVELVARCAEHGTERVLVNESAFSNAFFDLSTGVAGELVQKLQTYRLRMAAVLRPIRRSDAFRRFASEARAGRTFRVFDAREDAVRWLCDG